VKHFDSPHLQNALDILRSIQSKTLTHSDREKITLDLAHHVLREASCQQLKKEKKRSLELNRMVHDPKGKYFTLAMIDQCFRSQSKIKTASELIYLLNQLGIPSYMSFWKRSILGLLQVLGPILSAPIVPLLICFLKKESKSIIFTDKKNDLSRYLARRKKEKSSLHLYPLGNAVLSEEEADRRLQRYLCELSMENVEGISIRLSTLFSQINLLAWEDTVGILCDRLRLLYRTAMQKRFLRKDGTSIPKWVALDMGTYADLSLSQEVFKRVLSDPEFFHLSAGITLQSYLPDSFEIQKDLTEWALQRLSRGGAPIKIRLVKGINLALEQVEASLKNWPQAPYLHKWEVDANYKRMLVYGFSETNRRAAYLGVASHNLFDLCFALILREETRAYGEISFELLRGVADPFHRAFQPLSHDTLVYYPIACAEDFQSVISHFSRRLIENATIDSFFRYLLDLKPDNLSLLNQITLFQHSYREINQIYSRSRRTQNRCHPPPFPGLDVPFENEADTDFSLEHNRKWAETVAKTWHKKEIESIPCVIAGVPVYQKKPEGKGIDPSYPEESYYRYSLMQWEDMDQALRCAKSYESSWGTLPFKERCYLLALAAQKMRERRGDLIGALIGDAGKTLWEADLEVSQAIDCAEYYRRSFFKMRNCKDIFWEPRGTFLVGSSWKSPISNPAGDIFASLVAGNCVLFMPAPETVLCAWMLANVLWEAGIPKEVLQFINCLDYPVLRQFIADTRLSGVILNGNATIARSFKQINPHLYLLAGISGKNSMIITALADRDLAIQHLVESAFSYNGQNNHSAHLAILEAEVYDDPSFQKRLKEAIESLPFYSQCDLYSRITPLINAPQKELLQALTTLDSQENWLVHPQADPKNPHLWSPGVKKDISKDSLLYRAELSGPILGLMRASNLQEAIHLANNVPDKLSAGLHSLSEKEQRFWINKIETGNCFINRSMAQVVVRRQPFGGSEASHFGPGAKIGGPNYVAQVALPTQIGFPDEKYPVKDSINQLTLLIKNWIPESQLGLWYSSTANYAYWAKRFFQSHDPSLILGQDNLFRYAPIKNMCLRIQGTDQPIDLFRSLAAALATNISLDVSYCPHFLPHPLNLSSWKRFLPSLHLIEEPEETFCTRLKLKKYQRIRLHKAPSEDVIIAAAQAMSYLIQAPVLTNGRFELLHYLREISLSIDYHRYGNLGMREAEPRKAPL
jgi:RHH-type transcriptional regulator, proline utilization regulon repressor / proline dehydrogenase / delta 1-pyrroline-5-carboxylate dehydrogenase